MEDLICYFNGEYIKENAAHFSMRDWALRDGAIYEMARTYNHVPFFVREHIDRLFRSLRYVQIDLGHTPDEMEKITAEIFERNKKHLEPEDDFVFNYVVTRGVSPFLFPASGNPTVLVNCINLISSYEKQAKNYREGIHLVLVSTRQIPTQCLDVKSKNTNRFCNSLATFEAKAVSPEALPLMLDINGFVAEGSMYNCSMVKDGKIFTPKPTNVLGGISQGTLFRLAGELGIEVVHKDLCSYDLYNADEMFINANSYTMYPVAKFNQRVLAKPIPGPITQKLYDAFSKLVGVDIVQRVINYVMTKGG